LFLVKLIRDSGFSLSAPDVFFSSDPLRIGRVATPRVLLFLLVVWGVGGVGFASSFVLFVLFVFAVVWRFSFVVFVFVCLLFCLCVLFLSEERSRVLH